MTDRVNTLIENKIQEAAISMRHQNELEGLVDRYALDMIVEALQEISYVKADYARSTLADEGLARAWESNAKILENTASRLEKI